MSDSSEPTAPTAPASPTEPAAPSASAPAPAPSVPALSLDAIRAMVAEEARKAYDRGAADARRSHEKGSKPAASPAAQPAAPPAGEDGGNDAVSFAEDLNDAMSGLPFTREQRRVIREDARRSGARNADEVVQRWAALMGVKSTTTEKPAASPPPATDAPAAAQKPAIPTTPPPAAPALDSGKQPIFRELPEQARTEVWHAYVRNKGGNPHNPYDPKTRAAMRELRTAFEAEAATATVMLGGRQR